MGPEDVAIPVLVAGHTEGEFSVSTATELKEVANGDLLELNGRGRLWDWVRGWGGRAFAQNAVSASSWTFAKHRLMEGFTNL
jgi:hypothetical protein